MPDGASIQSDRMAQSFSRKNFSSSDFLAVAHSLRILFGNEQSIQILDGCWSLGHKFLCLILYLTASEWQKSTMCFAVKCRKILLFGTASQLVRLRYQPKQLHIRHVRNVSVHNCSPAHASDSSSLKRQVKGFDPADEDKAMLCNTKAIGLSLD